LLLTAWSIRALFSRVKGYFSSIFHRKSGAAIELGVVCGLAAVLFEQSVLLLDDLPVGKAFFSAIQADLSPQISFAEEAAAFITK
jgi:hypothetical protein